MNSNKKEIVVVFRDQKSRTIETFINLEGHGSRIDLKDFISLLNEEYGSPFSTFTAASHGEKLLIAAETVILEMKKKTREVAAINIFAVENQKVPE